MTGRPADPLATIREALALHLSMAAAGEQPTARSLKSLDDGISALAAVERLVEAARPMANLPYPLSADERQQWLIRQNQLRAALEVVAEVVEGGP